jgi:hypothetical protein
MCRSHGGFFTSRLALLDRSTAIAIAPKLCIQQASNNHARCIANLDVPAIPPPL